MVPRTQEPRAADSRSSPRGDSAGAGRTDVGAGAGRPRRASWTVHRGRPAAVSDRPRAAVPNRGAAPPHDHEEGAVQEETALTPGRAGAALSRNAGVLALSRTVGFFWPKTGPDGRRTREPLLDGGSDGQGTRWRDMGRGIRPTPGAEGGGPRRRYRLG